MEFEPWSKYPALTKERLATIGRLMWQARSDTSDLHDPGGGDNGWSLGCRAYARTCYAVRMAVGDYAWLTIVKEDQNHQFTFAIGNVPIRFYHGEATDAPSKYATVTFGELRQWRLFDTNVEVDEVLRIAIETDANGKPTAITLLELAQDNKPGETYLIPRDDGKVVPMQSKGIDLSRPKVEAINSKIKKKRKEGRDAG